jgi:CheY-like chemotaxis protein
LLQNPGTVAFSESMMSTGTPSGARLALIVDDNPSASAINGAMLEAAGWTVDHARDGFEAIVKFRSRNYNAVVLDYRLPGMDGVAVLAWMRRHLASCPEVVVVSSDCLTLLEEKFGGLGVKAILQKPVSPVDLCQVLQAA